MRKILAVLAVFALALSLLTLPTLANHEMPKNIPGLSATSLPDTNQLVAREKILRDLSYGLIWRVYYYAPNPAVIVAITTAMPWAPDKAVIWEWRIPTENGGWHYFAAFSPETIIETISDDHGDHIFKVEKDASGNIIAVTVTFLDKNGQASGVSKTFTKPEKN